MSDTVPEGWGEYRQGDVANFSNGRAYKLDEWESHGTPVIRLQNLTGSGKDYYYSNLNLPDRQYCEYGDLLYMWSATFGPHIWKGPKAIYHYHIWKVTPDEVNLTKVYAYQLLGFKTSEWLNTSNGMGILHVTKGGMEDLPLTLPPLPEQQKIAAILSSVDNVIEKTRAQIDKLKDLKTGMMQELLTKGIGHTEFKDSPVGRIPKQWGITNLGSIVVPKGLQTGPFGSQLHAHEYVEQGVPVVMPKDMKNNRIDSNSIANIPQTRAEQLDKHKVQQGDLLFARRGDIGRFALVEQVNEGWLCGTGCLRVRLSPQLNPIFISCYLTLTPVIEWLNLNAVGQTMLNLNTSILTELPIILPPADEQKIIGDAISALDRRINSRKRKLDSIKYAKKALMQDLLTGKVRVKVDQKEFEVA